MWKLCSCLLFSLSLFAKDNLKPKQDFPYKDSWGLFQSVGPNLNVPEAWNLVRPKSSIIVAVIDTGVDINHPDLKDSIWKNEKEICGNDIDDDHNGYVDDCYGVNLVSPGKDPLDDHGHGTHIAGIIAGQKNERAKFAGVFPGIKIMPIKYYSANADGVTNLKRTIEGLKYAIKMGAKIINYSGGGPEFSQEEYSAIKEALGKGILMVAAAGNEHNNTDKPKKQFFPASYELSNIISVASINPNGGLLDSSNFGKRTIAVAAPGESIKSTIPDGKYGFMTGTSQATAFVTGISAMMMSVYMEIPQLSPQDMIVRIKEGILQTVNVENSLKDKIETSGVVDAAKAVNYALNNKTAMLASTSIAVNRSPTRRQESSPLLNQLKVFSQQLATRLKP